MKLKIKNRLIKESGEVVFNSEGAFLSLFVDPKILETASVDYDEEIKTYNKWAKTYDYPAVENHISIDHKDRQNTWLMPEDYKKLDIERYILGLCKSLKEEDRVNKELREFQDRNLYDLLRYLVYFTDTLRKNNVLWGIGRGSSVSSYVLFLIGIHRVNSIQYNLDYKEFFK